MIDGAPRVIAIGLLLLSCAAAPAASGPPPARVGEGAATKPPADPPRIKDSVPERAAALRGADPNLNLDSEDERWGIDAARERKRRTDQRAADTQQQPSADPNAHTPVPSRPGWGVVPDSPMGGVPSPPPSPSP